MNAKNLKFMQLFEEFSKSGYLADPAVLEKYILMFINHDYQMAVDVWEYLTIMYEQKISKDSALAETLGERLFTVFYDKSAPKCIKAINDTPSVRRAIYQYSPRASYDDNFIVFTDLMVANKVEQCEEILKCLIKNERISFGDAVKRSLERVFIELLKKNQAKIEMSKKLCAMLTGYVKKIKTDERPMLEQRLREIQ